MREEYFPQQLEAICNNVRAALFLMDESQHCTYLNPAAETLTGYTLEELQGKPMHNLVHHSHPDGSPYPVKDCPISRAFSDKAQQQGEEVFVHKEGYFYEVAFTASPICAGQEVCGVVLEVRNITNRKRREAHLAFLVELSEDFNRLSSSEEILQTAGSKIGKHLKVTTCSFHDIDDVNGTLTLTYAWRSTPAPNRPRSYRINDYFSHEFRRASRAGETIVVRDTQDDDRTDSSEFAELGIRSFVTVPLPREGKWRYLLSVTNAHSRNWHEDEILLIQEFANRVFLRFERARAEEALRDKEVRYRSLFEAIHQGFGILEMVPDSDGHLTDFRWLETNPAFKEHTGFTNSPSKLVSEMIPGLEQRWAEIYGRVALTGVAEQVVEHSEALGRWFEVEAFRIGDPEKRRVAALFNDITERKHFEEALRESEQRYRSLFTSMAEGFCVIEKSSGESDPLDFRYIEANPAFTDQSGLDKVVGRTLREIAPTEEEAEEWTATFDAVLRTGKPLRFERPLVEQSRVLELYAYRIEDETQRRVAVIFSDITAHKQIEKTLRAADQRKDEFLAVLAHELRNPLGAVRNAVNLLEKHCADPASRSYLDILDRQSRTLNGLVDDLLDVSRVTRGLVAPKKEKVNLELMVERAVESTQSLIHEKQHKLRVSPPDQPVTVIGDPVRLEQIISNLLTNAIKYTDPGGRIEVILASRGENAKLQVRDNGIGIEPEIIERVFDLFGQAERGLARSRGGLGIGLTIVKNLVELHGGRVEAKSAGPGKGAEFTVTLPLAEHTTDNRNSAAAPAKNGHSPAKATRILVVEDNKDVATTLALLLEHAGHQVTVVHDGPAALFKAPQLQPEIIFLDIGLPGMDGYEVARRLRQNPATQNAAIAAITGYGQANDLARARSAGFDTHFTKPVDIDALETFVRRKKQRKEAGSE